MNWDHLQQEELQMTIKITKNKKTTKKQLEDLFTTPQRSKIPTSIPRPKLTPLPRPEKSITLSRPILLPRTKKSISLPRIKNLTIEDNIINNVRNFLRQIKQKAKQLKIK